MNAALWVTVVVALLGGGTLGGIAALVMVRPQRDRIKADTKRTYVDAAEVLTNQALALLAPLQRQILYLEQQVENLARDLDEARERERTHLKELDTLRDQLERCQSNKEAA